MPSTRQVCLKIRQKALAHFFPARKTPRRALLPDRKDCLLAIAVGTIAQRPNGDCDFYCLSCTAGADNDTLTPGFVASGRNVVRYAYRLTANQTTRTMSADYNATTGVFSFDFSAGTDNAFDLCVWVR